MMKARILEKLRRRAGETIAETLVALLVSALAMLMLAGAVESGTHAITRSTAKMNEYYEANNALAKNEKGKLTEEFTGNITLVDIENSNAQVYLEIDSQPAQVNFYRNATLGSSPVVSYRMIKDN